MNRSGWVLFVTALVGSVGCRRVRSEHATVPAPGYGTVMAEVGRRYEQLGLAGMHGRWELAEYQLGEIEEAFGESLPLASLPKEGHPEVLAGLASEFSLRAIPKLRSALQRADVETFRRAFGEVVAMCNGCHQASGHGFIEVGAQPGRAIPVTDPIRVDVNDAATTRSDAPR